MVLCRQLEAAEELARLAATAEPAPCAVDAEQAAGVTTLGSGKSMDTLREVAAEYAAQVMLRRVARPLLAQESCLCSEAVCAAVEGMQRQRAQVSYGLCCTAPAGYHASCALALRGLGPLLAQSWQVHVFDMGNLKGRGHPSGRALQLQQSKAVGTDKLCSSVYLLCASGCKIPPLEAESLWAALHQQPQSTEGTLPLWLCCAGGGQAQPHKQHVSKPGAAAHQCKRDCLPVASVHRQLPGAGPKAECHQA